MGNGSNKYDGNKYDVNKCDGNEYGKQDNYVAVKVEEYTR